MRYSICCIGHVTLDKIITPSNTVFMPGGTAFYFSHALAKLCKDYCLVTAVAESEIGFVKELETVGIQVSVLPTRRTVAFENNYGANTNERTQRVWQQADPFQLIDLTGIDADIIHLGPLLANDIPADAIKALAAKGKISLDVQGLVREVRNEQVVSIDWKEKRELLPYVHFLKTNEEELKILTGDNEIEIGARRLAEWGAKEVIITLGSKGALLYANHQFTKIKPYPPKTIVDPTGCGDTFMAGYLFKRITGSSEKQAGEFAAAMATCKLQVAGAFTGTAEDVLAMMNQSK